MSCANLSYTKCSNSTFSYSNLIFVNFLLQSISPTLYEQHFCQYSLVNKIQTQTTKIEKSVQNNLVQKAAHKILLKLTYTYSQFHQHFMSSFCANILSPKNYKAKLLVEKSCAKHFCTKRLHIKCW